MNDHDKPTRDTGGEKDSGDFELRRNASEPHESDSAEEPVATRSVDVDDSDQTTPRKIGNYKLLQQVGEGGMGTVWMAEQQTPVRRRVAIKLIRADMSSKEIVARFEAERQALAMMDHQNIARVLDAGTTDNGAPYFVMELVKGIPLTRYCDENKLSIQQRLKLFIPVCSAVQHAHQKGIIHRDLKPSNVLVTLYDGQPVPKVIDFGLAKALDQTNRLTDKSLFTQFGKVVGTLQYMAPEQAESGALDVDTRADIYSLGVMLYELLTGSTPLERATIGERALLQLLAMIREAEPPRPSHRLSSSEEQAVSSISHQRQITPSRLQQILRGELDWIVMKALEKDRTRRYDTATGFADDIQHYLDGEVVEARPPSATYRVKKFVRRNRAGVIATAAVVLALVSGLVGTSWSLARAIRAERSAITAKDEADEARQAESKRAEGERLAKLDALEQTRRAEAAQRNSEKARQLAEAETRAKEAALENETRQRQYAEAVADFVENDFLALTSVVGQMRVPGDVSSVSLSKDTTLRELLDRAAEKLESRTDLDPIIEARLKSIVGNSYRANGDAAEGIPFLERALEIRKAVLGFDQPETLASMNSIALAYQDVGQLNKALPLYEKTLELRKANLGDDHLDTLASMGNIASAYQAIGRLDEALPLHEQTLELMKAKLGVDHTRTLVNMNNAAAAYQAAGQLDKALPLYQKTLELMKARLGVDHLDTLLSMNNAAGAYQAAGQLDKALPLFEQALELRKTKLGDDHTSTLATMNNLAGAYKAAGQLGKALLHYEKVLELTTAKLGDDHPRTLVSMNNLASTYHAAGQLAKALPHYEKTLKLMKVKLGYNHTITLTIMNNLATAYESAGRLYEALPLYEKTLELKQGKLGDDHPGTLISMNNAAGAYLAAGQLDKALPLFEQALRLRKVKLGDDHPRTLVTMSCVAEAYQAAGQLDKALPLQEQAFELMKTKLGKDHPDTLISMSRVAGAYQAAGQLDKALPLQEQAFELMKTKLGKDHPDTLISMSRVAGAYQAAGQLDKALPLQEQAFELMKTKLGKDHPDTLISMSRVAGAYQAAGQLDKALPLQEQAFEQLKTKLGKDHPDTLLSMSGLASVYGSQNKLEQSLPISEEVVQKQKAKLGRKHPDTLSSIANLGINYRDAGRFDEAIELLEEVVEQVPRFRKLKWARPELRTTYLRAGRNTEFSKMLEQDLAESRATMAGDSTELAEVLARSGRDLMSIDNFEFAERLLRESVTIREKKIPDDWRKFNSQSLLGSALLGKAEHSDISESKQEQIETERMLAEALPLLVDGFTGLKERSQEIPAARRQQWQSEAVDRLLDYAEFTGDDKMLEKWKAEKEALVKATEGSQ